MALAFKRKFETVFLPRQLEISLRPLTYADREAVQKWLSDPYIIQLTFVVTGPNSGPSTPFSAATSDQEGRPRRDAPTGRLDFSQPRNDPSITRALDRVIRPTHQRRVRIRRIEPIQQIIQAAPSALLQLSRRGWRRLSELRIKRLSDLVLRIFKVQSRSPVGRVQHRSRDHLIQRSQHASKERRCSSVTGARPFSFSDNSSR